MAKEKKQTQSIAVDLSDAQCLDIGKREADLSLLYEKIDAEAKATAKEFRERLTKIWEEIQELAKQQKDKVRMENVEVVEIFDEARQTVKICRADDERQILKTRAMTLGEMAESRQREAESRQVKIPLEGSKVAAGEQKVVELDKSRKRKKHDTDPAPAFDPEPDETIQ
jgi:hypothetical protein